MIDDDDVESESDDDVTKVKQNVMKDNTKRERLAQLLQSCKCSGGVITSTKQGSVEYDELGDVCEDSEDASSPCESEGDGRDRNKYSKTSYPSFEKGKRIITSAWVANNYTELLMIQPRITSREFKKIVDQDQNSNVSHKARYKPIVSTLEDIVMSVMSRVGTKHELSIREHRVKVEDYIDDYYLIEKYKKAYACTINPINGRNLWEQVGVQIHPPEFKDTKKNLAFKRKPEEGESSYRRSKRCGTGQVSRKGQKHTCSKCGGVGYTKKRCKMSKESVSNADRAPPVDHGLSTMEASPSQF
ncbi:hypothetical protein Cgig2_008295 [Carnegiea gigantea]|uniref:Uncharacterized protein n=1 Tax=Carnegiea gigantea TaxID=171969 RepID=A0A9Q1GW67_9CARY|nr:hypothetical protein Cgig2_008295 [Carnegiea gigantea]